MVRPDQHPQDHNAVVLLDSRADGQRGEEDRSSLELLEVEAYSFASQYAQIPVVAGGNLFKDEWLTGYTSLPALSYRMIFADTAQNVVLIGGPGTGKTHLATAIAVSGIAAKGKRVRFYSTVDLVNVLEREKRDGKAGRLALSLLRMDLVILDELGYLPFTPTGGALLFHLISKL